MTKTLFFRFFVFAGLLGGLIVASCDKTDDLTIVEGIVTDANTGVILKGVFISYAIHEDSEKDETIRQTKISTTDTSGHYQMQCLESQYISGIVFAKEGYQISAFSFSLDVKEGEYNEINIPLKPK